MFEFSVLIPVYIKENADYMALALASILDDQTLKPNEVVIVEDGPITPQLDDVLNKFGLRYPQIIRRYKLDKNQGMGVAMNHGLKQVTHEWVARMDSDDIARADRFECQVNFLKSNPNVDVLGSSIEEFDDQVGDLKRSRRLPSGHDAIVSMMKFRNPINHMTVIYRRDLAIAAGGYWSHRYFEDYNLWYEMKKKGARFQNLQDNLMLVRVGNDMVGRRRGYGYFEYEKILMRKFFNDKFITPFQFFALLLVKFSLRVMPTKVLKGVYTSFLRKSA